MSATKTSPKGLANITQSEADAMLDFALANAAKARNFAESLELDPSAKIWHTVADNLFEVVTQLEPKFIRPGRKNLQLGIKR